MGSKEVILIKSRTNLLTFRREKVKIRMSKCIGGGAVAIKFTPQQREATMDKIERALSNGRAAEAWVKIEKGEVVVLQVDKKRVAV